MPYDLIPRKQLVPMFSFGIMSWPVLLEQFGMMFPFMQFHGRWFFVSGADERFHSTHSMPQVITNDGFRVTAAESRMMAQMTRNFVHVQRQLERIEEKAPFPPDWHFESKHWPNYLKVHDEWIDKCATFAEWAEQSGGFKIE
jgi:hypothetical protein